MKKPTIVLLSAFLSPFRSGAEACAEEVSMRLAGEFDITIVTARLTHRLPEDDPFRGKVRVVRVGLGLPIDKWLFPFLAPFAVWRLKPQVVHAVLESYAGLALLLSHFFVPQAKTVLTCQSTNTSFLVAKMHRRADRVTVISRTLLKRASDFGRMDALLIPNGVDIDAIRIACERHPKDPSRILFVGRLEPMKGIDVLLKAFARLNPAGRARLRIVGGGSERERLEGMVKSLGLGERVTFAGYVPSSLVYGEYAEAEIFCGLSRSEALGNVFLEAQAAGCAVIATRIGGIPDIVEDQRTGILLQPEDVEGAVQALELLLSDARKRAELVDAGRLNAQTYDWSGIAERYAEVYRSLLS
ncbi:MAG: glycosyltransferase family 4 protein [Candidatus Peribacteraceae bacterium]|nr:glycosyltransferase family 4 protein [Candidatus Peribacteraceae bacterium]